MIRQCWDADPLKRPDIVTLLKQVEEIRLYYQNISNEEFLSDVNNNLEVISNNNDVTSGKSFKSKVYNFENMPEPKNATEGNINYI